MPLLDWTRLEGHRQKRLAHFQLSIMAAGYVWQWGDKGASKVSIVFSCQHLILGTKWPPCQIWSTKTHQNTHMSILCTLTHAHTHVCACMRAHTHILTHTHAHMHARTNVCTHTHMHACTHTRTFSPIRLFTCCCSISLLTIMVGHKNTISLLCPDYLIALI